MPFCCDHYFLVNVQWKVYNWFNLWKRGKLSSSTAESKQLFAWNIQLWARAIQTEARNSAQSSAEDGDWDFQFSFVSVEKHKHAEQEKNPFSFKTAFEGNGSTSSSKIPHTIDVLRIASC